MVSTMDAIIRENLMIRILINLYMRDLMMRLVNILIVIRRLLIFII